ncbi:hypothetical protein N7492_001637 [Penicillium capsulatum]|uniref:ER membrane protein complex subunit 1 n=1 Tax=Penicillium capsulatum TaxID=69766 RepID=A0A9W9IY50_9EURO|nr:hypothetical protein N7492_001637 [Penicillium capsulatum]KAJ6129310.1 hypothetical protein N7512_002090 [Penicillium capsulatum]
MRLHAALLLAACASPAAAIYPDEVNHVDFHHALLGAPSPDSTFFLKPSSSSNASLLYTLSEKSILGAVNPRDGTLVWRQNLTRSGTATGAGILRGSDGNNAVVGATGGVISSWSAQDGKLGWESQSVDGVVADLELLELADASATPDSRDTLALVNGDGVGIVRRLDGDSGEVKWEHKDISGDIPFQVSSSPTEVFLISLQSALLKGTKIKVTSLDSVTGRQTAQHTLSTENEVSGPDAVLFVGSNAAAPLIVWTDKSQKTLKVNVIGTKQISSLAIDNASGQDIEQITVHAPRKLNSLSHFLVHYKTTAGSWAEVYHVDVKSSAVSKAYQLPFLQGSSAVATSNVDANVYFTRIAGSEAVVVSSASHGILGRWNVKEAPADAVYAVSDLVTKGSSVAVRLAVLQASGDWQLIRNGQTEWTRHEGLIDTVAAAWADYEDQEGLAHELEVEGHESLIGAYIHRVKRHLRDLEHLPAWLKELPQRVLSSVLADEVSNLDSFGVANPVIVATKQGRIYALDTGKQGAVMWSVQAAETSEWDVKAIITSPGVATIYPSDGSSVTVNITTGQITSSSVGKDMKLQSIAALGNQQVLGIKENGYPTSSGDIPGFLVTTSSDGRVLGWASQDSKTPVWEFVPASDQRIVHASARPAHDPVASIGKVLGDRSVLYKYLNPNLVLVTAVNEAEHKASFYLLDGVSGKVLHTAFQAGVDTSQPIASAISENWFSYSFFGDVLDFGSSAKGYQLVISELYESSIPNDRGGLGDAGNYSSFDGLPVPHVISQAFVIDQPISHMAVTQTRQGITVRQLLCTLPSTNSIIGIPRPLLDPRRPVDRDPTSAEAEEGLFRYAPFLLFEGKWYLTHSRDVAGIHTVLSRPTLLESTSVVFAFGSDIFGTRATPSHAFDILGKSFSKMQLLLTVVALAVGVSFLAPMARKKQVNMLWKAT